MVALSPIQYETLKWRVRECHELAVDKQQAPKLDLSDVDLRGMDLRGIPFQNVAITLDPECSFVDTIVDQNVLEALLPAIRMANISLKNIHIASALEGRARGNNQLGGEVVTHYVPLQGLNLEGAIFDGPLRLVNLIGASLRGCNLRFRDFMSCLVGGLDVDGADLQGAQFSNKQADTLKNYKPAQGAHIHAAKTRLQTSAWVELIKGLLALLFEPEVETTPEEALPVKKATSVNPYQVPPGAAIQLAQSLRGHTPHASRHQFPTVKRQADGV
jgi:hypothetical protein